MKNTALVRVVYRPGQSFHQSGRFASWLGHASDLLGQAAAINILQRQVGTTLPITDFINVNDVGMI
jgi:hypothetical protein